jgi:hypothetical protein
VTLPGAALERSRAVLERIAVRGLLLAASLAFVTAASWIVGATQCYCVIENDVLTQCTSK